MHVIIAQPTAFVSTPAHKMMEYGLFRAFETAIHCQSPHCGANPDVSTAVARDITHLAAQCYGILAKPVPMIDKYFLAILVNCQIVQATRKRSHPDASLRILVDTVHIVIAQAVHIAAPMLVAGQFVA